MTREQLPSVVGRYFPGHAGIILTGSQAEHEDIYAGSDIDLLVFHPDYSTLYNTKLNHGGFKYDFTLAPLFDIENTVFNQSCDLNGTFLSMAATGVILDDPHSILRPIQQYVKGVFNQVSGNTRGEYNRLLKELGRMNKLFKGELREHERLFLVCEFVSTVVSIETIRIRKWRPTIKHRARLLFDKNRELTVQLIDIVRKSVLEGAIKDLKPFLEYYNKLRETGMDMPVRATGGLTVDLAFADFSMKGFVDRVLPAIDRDPALAAGYRYYYASPGNYWPAYRHHVSIRMDADDPDKTMELVEVLERVLGGEGQSLLETAVIVPKERAISEPFDRAIEAWNIRLCRWHTELIKEEQYVRMRLVAAISLCSLLRGMLGLTREDLIRANLFLSQRWLIRQRELKSLVTYEALRELRVEKYRMLNDAFRSQKAWVLPAMEGIPAFVSEELERMLVDRAFYTSTAPFSGPVLDLIEVDRPEGVFIYMTLAEEIVQMLNLGIEQKSQCFYFMNEAGSVLASGYKMGGKFK
jgi:hypothetical protein